MIRRMLDEGKSDDEIVRAIMRVYRVPEGKARFMLAIVRGDVEGDVVSEDPPALPGDDN